MHAASRADAVILVRNNLQFDARVRKESLALSAAGMSVVRAGIRTTAEDITEEHTEFDRIIRVHTSRGELPSRDATGGGAPGVARRRTAVGDLKHFVGRIRENRLIADAVEPLAPKCVVACDLTTLPAGRRLQRRLGARLVYDAHELYTEMRGRSRLAKVMYGALERRLIRKADLVITVSGPRADELARRYRIDRPLVVMNGPDACLGETPSTGGPLKVVYQGGFTPGRGLEGLVRAMSATGDGVHLTMQGFGGLDHRLRAIADELRLGQRVRFADPVPPEGVIEAARGFDVGIAFYEPDCMNNYLASPNKVFDYMAAGVATLGSDLPVLRELVADNGCGVLVEGVEPDVIAAALSGLAERPEETARLKARAAEACSQYLWDDQVADLVRRIQGFVAGSSDGSEAS